MAGQEPVKPETVIEEPTHTSQTVPLSELMSERKKRQGLETQLASVQAKLDEIVQAQTLKDGDAQKLVVELQAKVKDLEKNINDMKTAKEEGDAVIMGFRQEILNSIPEELRDKADKTFSNITQLKMYADTVKNTAIKPVDGGRAADGNSKEELKSLIDTAWNKLTFTQKERLKELSPEEYERKKTNRK